MLATPLILCRTSSDSWTNRVNKAYNIHDVFYLFHRKKNICVILQIKKQQQQKSMSLLNMPLIEDHWTSIVCVSVCVCVCLCVSREVLKHYYPKNHRREHWLTVSMSHTECATKAGSLLTDIFTKDFKSTLGAQSRKALHKNCFYIYKPANPIAFHHNVLISSRCFCRIWGCLHFLIMSGYLEAHTHTSCLSVCVRMQEV